MLEDLDKLDGRSRRGHGPVIVTPGEILSRCRALDARMAIATQAIAGASADQADAAFRDAWNARPPRWAEIREQCGDWAIGLAAGGTTNGGPYSMTGLRTKPSGSGRSRCGLSAPYPPLRR